jgi:malate dehydrogenase (oxaloacetate-decarboxylating)(NADP+)
MNIPVMHDDQHGTAIISAAALLNACEIFKKKMDKVKIVVNGAGAAAISCTKLYVSLGAKKENIIMCDRSGVIRKDREVLDDIKAEFATDRKINTLAEAMKDSDVFIGLSSADCVTAEMLTSMAKILSFLPWQTLIRRLPTNWRLKPVKTSLWLPAVLIILTR